MIVVQWADTIATCTARASWLRNDGGCSSGGRGAEGRGADPSPVHVASGRRRVCLRRRDDGSAVLQYGLAVAELAAAATRLGNAPLALSACRLACELSAAAPPWRLAQLWQLLPPGALLQLGGLLVAGLGRARKGNSTSSAATRGAYPLADIGDGAALWLQAVTASQPPPRPMRADDAGGLALARALAGALQDRKSVV